QLPQELESVVTERNPDDDQVNDDVDDFLRRVAKHLGDQVDPEQARSHVRAVFATLNKAVTEGEVADLRSQLPAGFGPRFEERRVGKGCRSRTGTDPDTE